MRSKRNRRNAVISGFLLATVAAMALVVLPAAAENTSTRLTADIVATNPGPLTTCAQDGSDCGLTNIVRQYIYVANANRLQERSGLTRAAVPGAFVVNRIDVAIFVDGVDNYDLVEFPPPDTNYPPYAGHWPVAVTCPSGTAPCDDVSGPAVLPGERTSVFYLGWAHGREELDGLYVFRYTIHGTLDGSPVDLTASSPPIRMIR